MGVRLVDNSEHQNHSRPAGRYLRFILPSPSGAFWQAGGDGMVSLRHPLFGQCVTLTRCDVPCSGARDPRNQAVDVSFSVARCSEGSSMEEGGIFLVFLIHSAARCSASSSCSMVIVLLT
jgi:hypothetical protein